MLDELALLLFGYIDGFRQEETSSRECVENVPAENSMVDIQCMAIALSLYTYYYLS